MQTLRQRQYFKSKLFQLRDAVSFDALALELFRYQAEKNPIYSNFIQHLGIDSSKVNGIGGIPFLPIRFFKSHEVITGRFSPERIFSSSGTGGEVSRHFVRDLDLYNQSFTEGFENFYGEVRDYCILALLPSYLEREGSSLIYMAQSLIEDSSDPDSGFFLYNHQELYEILLKKIQQRKKCLLLGVSFALLDFAEAYSLPQNEIIIMETGGMKGRRKEMIRHELHEQLKARLGVRNIHSEYGMTELLSQAWSASGGRFQTPPWMKVIIREIQDPMSVASMGKTGGINLIDLANIDSCAFIESQDLGRLHPDTSFEVMGRFDNADIRGCNLMVV